MLCDEGIGGGEATTHDGLTVALHAAVRGTKLQYLDLTFGFTVQHLQSCRVSSSSMQCWGESIEGRIDAKKYSRIHAAT